MKKPVVLVVMDGVGETPEELGNMVKKATTPTLNELKETCPWQIIKAHGTAVGLPSDDDMGNSEVGHNALGCGQIYSQGAKLVNESIESGKIYTSDAWKNLVSDLKDNGATLHFIGLLSDGNVHSNISHLIAMLKEAKKEGVKHVRCHILLDGRDVPATSALEYVDMLEKVLAELNTEGCDYAIASGGGRMTITMDRYQANWPMVKAGWDTHVHGIGRQFATAKEAIETYRAETGVIDQDLPAFVIAENGKPVGKMEDGDSVILFNFRGDRALEITKAFEAEQLAEFDRGIRPDVMYAGMMEYDGDLHAPKLYLVNPPEIDRTMDEYLCATGVPQLAVSETQKFGHVTYFFNGNRSGKFSDTLDDYEEIRSDIVPFEQRPWMKCAEITDRVVEAIGSGKYGMIRLNFPNGDMVGHTGNMEAVIVAMESLDLCLARIKKAVEEAGGVLVISADHGNADDMLEHDKKGNVKLDKAGAPARKTSHSLNPVPCIVFDPESKNEYKPELREGLGISSLAATCIELLGYEPPADYDPSVLVFK